MLSDSLNRAANFVDGVERGMLSQPLRRLKQLSPFARMDGVSAFSINILAYSK